MKKLTAMVLFLILNGGIYAQQTTLSSGNNASGSGGSTSYSIGQIAYTTNSGTNGSSAQGVQQPFEIMVVAGIEITAIQLELNAYPNPTTNFLTLRVENYAQEKLTYQLTDVLGKLITSDDVTNELTQISMVELPLASYFLKVLDNNQLIKNFKIVKN